MKLIFLGLMLLVQTTGIAAVNDSVTTEIRYRSAEASEVFLVWGMNDWKPADKASWPSESYIKDGLIYTRMQLGQEMFTVNIKSPAGTKLDYVFWITKGPRNSNVDIWDLNSPPEKDYHTVALQDSVVLVESNLAVRPREALTILDFIWPVFFTILLLSLIVFLGLKHFSLKIFQKPSPIAIVLGSALTLLLLLLFIRVSVVPISWDVYLYPSASLPSLFWAGLHDLIYVDIITFLFLLLLFFGKRSLRASGIIAWSFVGICVLSLAAALVNIRIVEMLGTPFNYRWLYYSDFLSSPDSHSALFANISSEYVTRVTSLLLTTLMVGAIFVLCLQLIKLKPLSKKILLAGCLLVQASYFAFAVDAIEARKWNYDRIANPVTAFISSLPLFEKESDLFTMEVPDSCFASPCNPVSGYSGFKMSTGGKIKNVILFVLESTPAEYVQPYDQKFQITPELAKCCTEAVVFDNIYAHAPATNKSMVSLLASVPPWLSYNSITSEYPGIGFFTLSSELKRRGFRTAFFNSGDNSFQKAGEFLGNREFDVLADCNTAVCSKRFHQETKGWEGLDGSDDECTAEELMKWINTDTTHPFLGVIWTYQTHYPYCVTSEEKKYPTPDPVFNRYLNAVQHTDRVFGQLISELKKNHMYESTLIVVVGDHGEAFGRHNQVTHASGIYEENVHVPCVFINPALIACRNPAVGGIMDIAPTIMEVIGLPPSKSWEGRSLFSKNADGRTFFFSPWSDYLFGMRQGKMKYIFNASRNNSQLYDLQVDPCETKNLVDIYPERAREYHMYLAAWVQASSRYMEKAIAQAK